MNTRQLKIQPWLMLYCKNPHWPIIFQTKECNTLKYISHFGVWSKDTQ
jgi:hypothetical protein